MSVACDGEESRRQTPDAIDAFFLWLEAEICEGKECAWETP